MSGERSVSPSGRFRKLNLLIASWICIIIGSGLTLSSGTSGLVLAFAAPIAVGGVILLLIALRMSGEEDVDPLQIRDWQPDLTTMPEAGRIMYRIDTTLVEPIRTSILCGRCGELEWVDGGKPKSWVCPLCEVQLWEEEEE